MLINKLEEHNFKRQVDLVERPDYMPTHPQEVFMLAVLKAEIDKLINDYLPSITNSSKVLDVGCGRQPFRSDFESRGYSYFSLDAQQNPESSVSFVCEIDKALPVKVIELSPFDVIFCTEVMEHVVDWEHTFQNFSNLLGTGSKLIITCPYFYPLHEVPHDFWRATPYALQYYGDKFGFKVLQQNNAGSAWDVIGTLLGSSQLVATNNKISTRIVNKIARFCYGYLSNILANGFLQSNCQLNSSWYLSNVIVFEKNT